MALSLADYYPDYVAADIASQAAQAAYNFAKAQGYAEELALAKAKQAWDQEREKAQLTGTFQGNNIWDVNQALGVSPSGQALLNQQAQYGNSAGSAGGGMPTESAREFNVTSSGYLNGTGGQGTLGREHEQNQTTLGLLGILKDLRGPANAFQYARVLNGTPQGLRDIVNAAAGRYTLAPSGGGAPVVNPDGSLNTQPASLGTTLTDINGGGASQIPQTDALPNPNQVDLRNLSRMSPTQKSLLYGDYENQGYDPNDVKSMINASAPAYRGPRRGAYTGLFAA